MKRLLLLLTLSFTMVAARADIQMPQGDNFYDKLGRGIANVAFAPAEILDSHYTLTQQEGGTVGFCKGFLVQGPSRMVQDIGLGIFDIVTAPFPLHPGESYATFKMAPYDSMVVRDYPPADLTNWY
jgi:putative exosortase-associated protein (TIGR04073 family)